MRKEIQKRREMLDKVSVCAYMCACVCASVCVHVYEVMSSTKV